MYLYKQFLTLGECAVADSLESYAVQSKVGYNIETSNINRKIRESVSWPLSSKFADYLGQRFLGEVSSQLNVNSNFKLEEVHGLTYQPGGFFSPHRDNINNCRKLTGIILLSDSSDFEGGVLHIEVNSKYQPIYMRKGDLLIFSSNRLHYVSSVDSGERKIIVFWIY